jgi:hypothetical protein
VKTHLPQIEKMLLENKVSAYAAGKKLIDIYLNNTCKAIKKK